MATEKITHPIFYCRFNGGSSITHFLPEVDKDLYSSLPNLYIVLLKNKAVTPFEITGGFMIKTTLSSTQNPDDFKDACHLVIQNESNLKTLISPLTSLVTSKLVLTDPHELLPEEVMLHAMAEQYLKHSIAGQA